jgi:hypothetical protein
MLGELLYLHEGTHLSVHYFGFLFEIIFLRRFYAPKSETYNALIGNVVK